MNFAIGLLLGIVISSVGFTGVAKLLDVCVVKVQAVAKEATKN
jgi:hypothetical protein